MKTFSAVAEGLETQRKKASPVGLCGVRHRLSRDAQTSPNAHITEEGLSETGDKFAVKRLLWFKISFISIVGINYFLHQEERGSCNLLFFLFQYFFPM